MAGERANAARMPGLRVRWVPRAHIQGGLVHVACLATDDEPTALDPPQRFAIDRVPPLPCRLLVHGGVCRFRHADVLPVPRAVQPVVLAITTPGAQLACTPPSGLCLTPAQFHQIDQVLLERYAVQLVRLLDECLLASPRSTGEPARVAIAVILRHDAPPVCRDDDPCAPEPAQEFGVDGAVLAAGGLPALASTAAWLALLRRAEAPAVSRDAVNFKLVVRI